MWRTLYANLIERIAFFTCENIAHIEFYLQGLLPKILAIYTIKSFIGCCCRYHQTSFGTRGTVSFLQALGSLYDSLAYEPKEKTDMSLQDAVNWMTTSRRPFLKWKKVPYEGNPAQQLIDLKELCLRKRSFHLTFWNKESSGCTGDSITTINKDFLDDVELCTLLITVVENLYSVSHFKHETFNVLQYSQDFRTITKESLKRITKWGPSILPTISRTSTSRRPEFANINLMQPLLSEEISPDTETATKELV